MPTHATLAPTAPDLSPFVGLHLFTDDDYRAMFAHGVLTAGEPVEFVGGYVLYRVGYAPAPDPRRPFPQWNQARRWTTDEYHRMIDTAILTTDDRTELLDGYVVQKMPQNNPHRSAVLRLTFRLQPRLLPDWVVMTQSPALFPGNEPEPDGMILPGVDSDYDGRDVLPTDIAIVIEVSDTTLANDRGWKRTLYSGSAVPMYWIVNLADRQVEVYGTPDVTTMPTTYVTRTIYVPGQDVPVLLFGQQVCTIPVLDLIP